MSIAAKQLLLRDLEKKLANDFTVRETAVVLGAVSNLLNEYNIEEIKGHDADIESQELLTAFIEAKTIEGRSKKTIERYRYLLNRMLKEIGLPIRKISVYHIRNYLMEMKERGIADKTVEGTRSVLCTFFDWLTKEGLIETNPCANVNPIKCAKKILLPYSDVDIERLKESCETIRDKALISFLLSTGCRIGEVCELNKDSIDFQNLECKVHGKGDKERTVYLDNVTAMLLRRYLMQRTDLSPALFVGKGSERMTCGGVRARLHNIANRAGVEHVHPHRFRRTLATNLINHGMPIQEVAFILGHDRIDTTMKYIYIDKNNVKNAYRKYA